MSENNRSISESVPRQTSINCESSLTLLRNIMFHCKIQVKFFFSLKDYNSDEIKSGVATVELDCKHSVHC